MTDHAQQVLEAPVHSHTQTLIAAVPKMREQYRDRDQTKAIVLDVRNLCKTYRTRSGFLGRMREVEAVSDISFTLR